MMQQLTLSLGAVAPAVPTQRSLPLPPWAVDAASTAGHAEVRNVITNAGRVLSAQSLREMAMQWRALVARGLPSSRECWRFARVVKHRARRMGLEPQEVAAVLAGVA